VPIRRIGLGRLAVGEAAELPVLHVDVETLAVVPRPVRYERLGESSWRRVIKADGGEDEVREFTVDHHGLVVEERGRFRRVR
jgi:hypothetical protein